MIVIGLTGPSGAGKTALCNAALELGCLSINADEVYHSLLVPPSRCLDDISDFFGADVLNSDGTLNRQKLGKIVFSNKKKLEKLNSITHGYVKDEFRALIAQMRERQVKAVIVDAPTLFESGFDAECDVNICLLASRDLRQLRITERDGLTKESSAARLDAQKNDEFYISRADHTMYNNGSTDELRESFARLFDRIMEENNASE